MRGTVIALGFPAMSGKRDREEDRRREEMTKRDVRDNNIERDGEDIAYAVCNGIRIIRSSLSRRYLVARPPGQTVRMFSVSKDRTRNRDYNKGYRDMLTIGISIEGGIIGT